MTETISLLNMKGGVGKTTVAVNLAWHAYSRRKKRVLLVDLDPQFNASQYVMDFEEWGAHRKKNGTIAELLIEVPALGVTGRRKKRVPVRKRIARIREAGNQASYLDLLPSELALAFVVKAPSQMEYRLEKILQELRGDYDLVFIDCAPTDSVLTTMALTASDHLLIPVRPDRFSILGYANLRTAVQTFKEASNDPHNVQELGVVFTQVVGNSAIEDDCKREIREHAAEVGSYVFDSEVFFSRTFARAIQDQTPAFETKFARTELKECIAAVAAEVRDRMDELAEEKQ